MYYRNLVGAVLTEEEAKAEAEEVIYLLRLSPCSIGCCLVQLLALF